MVKLLITTMSFISENLARQAAIWWSQYLPGVKDINSSEIHDLEEDNPLRTLVENAHTKHKTNVVSREKVDKFIDTLQNKILQLKIERKIITLGHRSIYAPPKEVTQSVRELGIYAMFPFKTEMIIHTDGYILVDDEIVYLDENLRLLTAELLTEKVRVKINRPQFRLLKIDLAVLQGDLYQYDDETPVALDKFKYYNTWEDNKPYEAFYVEFKFDEFVGGEQALRNFSDKDLLDILQDKDKFIASIKNGTHLHYFTNNITKKNASYGNGWGELQYEDLGNGYFCNTTGIVNAFKVPSDSSYIVYPAGWASELIKVTDHHLLVPSKDNKFQVFDLNGELEFAYDV